MPAVSVIIPNYNHAEYLEKRIESVLQQTYRDFEIILLDDCSDDDSFIIINKYIKHPKVSKTIVNEKNDGSAVRQWEKGISESTGKYIWIAESDDFADKTLLETLVSELESKNVGITYCGSHYVNERNDNIYEPADIKEDSVSTGENFIRTKMIYGNSIYNSSAVVFKRELIKNLKFPRMKYCGDWLFWVKILQITNISVIEKKLNYYRRHENSVSNKSNKEGLQFIEGFIVLKYIKSNFLIDPDEWVKVLSKYSYRLSMFFIADKTKFLLHFRLLLISLLLDIRITIFTLKYLYYYLKNKSL
jgi:glycosyltransferase involved in cell wall biosynthesis